MDLLRRYQQFIKKENLFSTNDKLLLAVSGGIDSVVLCELCRQGGYDFTIVHCNFQLRGEESERDEDFVRDLGGKYEVEVKVKRFDTEKFAAENRMSIQEAARVLRYEWFNQLVKSETTNVNGDYVSSGSHSSHVTFRLLTAHHADDNVETVLMNFFRGTGLHGLTGIPVSGTGNSGYIRRPLLPFSKNELVEFARANNLAFVEDSSNRSSRYTRNFFRNEIIPAISKVYPGVMANLTDNIGRFKEIERLYQTAVDSVKKKLIKQKGNEWHIPIRQLMRYHNRALIYAIISDFGFTEKQIDEVIKLADSGSGKYVSAPSLNYRIIHHRHWMIISPVNSKESATIIIGENDKAVAFECGKLELEKLESKNHKPQTTHNVASLDASDISFPLILRKWKTGDYFYPLGMKKKKKLSRFFIDQKLSKTQKEKTWVIEMKKKIIWVIGQRIDERFKLTDKTTNILKVTFLPEIE